MTTRRYCQVCRRPTAQSVRHDILPDGAETVEYRCLKCSQLTARQRRPPANSQLDLL